MISQGYSSFSGGGASAPTSTIFLRATTGGPVVEVRVVPSSGVDLRSVGLSLGLDPASVRLNEHHLSRGPDFVSSSVTWSSLRSFFASRRLPAGGTHLDPILVRGLPFAVNKRKAVLQDQGPPAKKSRTPDCSNVYCNDNDYLSAKRKFSLEDDERPAKKNRAPDCGTVYCSDNFLSMNRKLSLEDDERLAEKNRAPDCGTVCSNYNDRLPMKRMSRLEDDIHKSVKKLRTMDQSSFANCCPVITVAYSSSRSCVNYLGMKLHQKCNH